MLSVPTIGTMINQGRRAIADFDIDEQNFCRRTPILPLSLGPRLD